MNISMNEIEKGIIRKTHSNSYTTNSSDVYISVTPKTKKRSTTVRFNYHFKWLKNFKFVTFSRVGNVLFFKLSNKNPDGTAYAISEKGSQKSLLTAVSGENADVLADFAGLYNFKEYDWQHSKEPIFYIEKGEGKYD